MSGMDMSNVPDAAILYVFYVKLVIWGAVWIGLLVLSFWLRNRLKGSTTPLHTGDVIALRTGGGRDWLRLGLGCLWILDGLLQAQPAMSTEFVPYLLVPLIDGQPHWLANLLIQSALLWGRLPIDYDVVVVWLQISLGVVTLFGRGKWLKAALITSLVWGGCVWLFGEGLGGIFTGKANWFTGAPGSALFYVAAAGLLLSSERSWRDGVIHRVVYSGLTVLWIGEAILQALPTPGNWDGSNLYYWITSMADMAQPQFLTHILLLFAHLLTPHFGWWNIGFIAIMTLLAWMSWRYPGTLRTRAISLVWLSFTWVFGQDFGVLGGLGTDPNTAPIIALLLLSAG